jgi:glycosyltransferase involved in cell wall biosynthesis
MKLTVIIPVLNGMPHLGAQLEALARQDPDFDWEVVIVDNGSHDGSLSCARSFEGRLPHLTVLSEPKRGKPYALNRGIDRARGDALVFLDQDDEVCPGYLEAMVRGLQQDDLVGASVDFDSMNPPWARYQGGQTDGLARRRGCLNWSSGAALAARASVAREIRFRTDNGVSDDIDFCWRAQHRGYSLGFVPAARVRYRQRTRPIAAFRQGYGYGLSEVLTYLNYRAYGHPRPDLKIVLWTIKSLLALALRSYSRAHRLRLCYWSGIVVGNLVGSVRWRVLYI